MIHGDRVPPERGSQVGTRSVSLIDRALEGCWLAVAALLPIFMVPEWLAVGYVQMPKVFLLRSATLLAVTLIVIEWALRSRDGHSLSDEVGTARLWLGDIWTHVRQSPIVASAIAVLLVTVVSADLSPMRVVSIEGTRPGWDTYALYNVAPYIVMFGLVATRMRTRAQVERLIWAVTGASILVGLSGIGQHFGIDPFRFKQAPVQQPTMTLGNPIFGTSWLLMAIPVTLAFWQSKRQDMGPVRHVLLGAGLIALPVTAFLFTLARGGFLSLGFAFVVFGGITIWLLGKRALYAPALSLVITLVFSIAVSWIPVPAGTAANTGDLLDRYETIDSAIAGTGTVNDRYQFWRVATNAYFNPVWPDHAKYPEIPAILAEPIRPFIGYGPDMFGYVYNVVGDPAIQSNTPWHAHNFVIHTALELGLLGVAAYAAMASFVGLALWTLLGAAKRGDAPEWAGYLLIGAAAIFWGRLLEQMAGQAQVSDLSLSWIIAGLVVALMRMHGEGWTTAPDSIGTSADNRQQATRPHPRHLRAAATTNVAHVMLATVVTVGILAFWWQAVGSTALSDSLAGRALIARINGDNESTARLLASAVNISGKNYMPRYILTILRENAANFVEDPEDRGKYLASALDVLRPVLARDPMNRQARVREAVLMGGLAGIRPDRYARDTLRNWEVVLRLMPGLWDSDMLAASAFINFGRAARGLEVVHTVRDQSAHAWNGLELDHLEAKALLRLNRRNEAQPFIDRVAASPEIKARAMLEDLAATQPE